MTWVPVLLGIVLDVSKSFKLVMYIVVTTTKISSSDRGPPLKPKADCANDPARQICRSQSFLRQMYMMQFAYVAVQHASFEALCFSSSLILITVVVTATEYVSGTGSSTNSTAQPPVQRTHFKLLLLLVQYNPLHCICQQPTTAALPAVQHTLRHNCLCCAPG